MTRDELQSLYESAIKELFEATPCRNCGGDSMWADLQIRQAAFFMTEMADQWKIAYQAKQAKTMSIKKVAKRARAKMERHFNAIIAKQLEESLSPTSDPEPPQNPAPDSRPASGPDTHPEDSREDSSEKDHSAEETAETPEPPRSPEPPPPDQSPEEDRDPSPHPTPR
jgi:hypothetical protein